MASFVSSDGTKIRVEGGGVALTTLPISLGKNPINDPSCEDQSFSSLLRQHRAELKRMIDAVDEPVPNSIGDARHINAGSVNFLEKFKRHGFIRCYSGRFFGVRYKFNFSVHRTSPSK